MKHFSCDFENLVMICFPKIELQNYQ